MSKKRGLMGARSSSQKVSKASEDGDRPERKKLFSFGKRLQEKIKPPSQSVRTTAYTHTESDHIRYGRKNAIGTTLMYGSTRSAAADWSIFPLGTKFQIEGDPSLYVIDDYGSALVGKRTIDLYKPSRGSMNAWGVRHVEIKVIEWGCPKKSLKMLEGRSAYRHVREMIKGLERKV
ncbi:MAG: 3D domain-containing protein [Verrucomicrobiales bacterium]